MYPLEAVCVYEQEQRCVSDQLYWWQPKQRIPGLNSLGRVEYFIHDDGLLELCSKITNSNPHSSF